MAKALTISLIAAGLLAGLGVVAWQYSAHETEQAEQAVREGVARTCNICGAHAPFEPFVGRLDSGCPACGSRERHRLLAYYLRHETGLFDDALDVLHFTPQPGEVALFRKQPKLNYKTAEYGSDAADLELDLTALDLPDESWDVLIVYHILEHIIDDQKAMAEMVRVLRPGGVAYIQVPLELGRTDIYEDASIVDPQQRIEHFGQWDHVRKYSAAGLRERLEGAGFEVEAVDYLGRLDAAVIEEHGLHAKLDPPLIEDIWVARKPG